jgi:colanic acid biosynthesis glycosyl transferase WcaI
MTLKILIYSANFAPEPTGIGKYSGEMAAWMTAQGHEVRVVAAPPYYPSWKIADGYAWPLYRREQWQGVDVWRAPLWVPSKPNGITRILHLLTFAISSLPVMLWQILWRPNVVMTIAPALMCAPTGWLVAKLSGGKAWLHIQDFEVDVAFQMNLLKGRRLESMVLGAERWLLSWFDVVSSISGRMLNKLRLKGVVEGRVRFFPNWVDIAHVYPLSEPSHYRKELGIEPNTKVVLFSGTLGSKQGLMVIPDAARKLSHRKDVLFVVCGDGATKPQLVASCKGLANVTFIPLQPFERLGQLLGLADIHLLPQSPEATDLVLPSKLTGMLASGMPIIATCRNDTEIASVVSKCGVVVPPEDGSALATAIEQLVDNDEARLEFGVQARIYSEENLARDSVLGRLLEQFTVATLSPPFYKQRFAVFYKELHSKWVAIGSHFRWIPMIRKPVEKKVKVASEALSYNRITNIETVEPIIAASRRITTSRKSSEMDAVVPQYEVVVSQTGAKVAIKPIQQLAYDDETDSQLPLRFDIHASVHLEKIRA